MSTNWRESAACRGTDPNTWFPVGTPGAPAYDAVAADARAICAACPVRVPCGSWALETGQEFGIFGGMDEHERAEILRVLPARTSVA
jgi:WhiB family transcriptional regulator, redox-sensing transcriptional regulator